MEEEMRAGNGRNLTKISSNLRLKKCLKKEFLIKWKGNPNETT